MSSKTPWDSFVSFQKGMKSKPYDMKNTEQKLSQTLPLANTTYRLGIAFMIAILLLILSPAKTIAKGYVEGVNISYEHMPMKVEPPTGDQKFTGTI